MDYSKIVAQIVPEDAYQQVCVDVFTKLVEASRGQTISVATTHTAVNSVIAAEVGFAGHKMVKKLNALVNAQLPENIIHPQTDEDFDKFEEIYFFACSNGKAGEVKFFLGHCRCIYSEVK